MAVSVRRLEIRVDQSGNAKKGLGSIRDSLGKLGAIAGPAAIGMAAVAAAATAVGVGAVAVGAKLVNLGSDAEEMLGKFNVVFGDSAEKVTKTLIAFGNEVGRSKYELMEMASTVQDTFVPLGFARETASDMSVELTKLATDVASFNNASDPDVMRDFQSAIVGNYETVRKYGIVLSEETVKQEAMRLGLATTTVDSEKLKNAQDRLAITTRKYNEILEKHGEGSIEAQKAALAMQKAEQAVAKASEGSTEKLTAQAKAQAVLNLITAGSSDAIGDAARTSGSWANQMRRLKSIVKDTATDMGLRLLPVVTPLLTKLGDFAEKIAPQVVEWFGRIANFVATTVVPKLSQFLRGFLVPFAQRIWMLVQTMLPELGQAFRSLGGFIGKALNEIKRFAAEAIPAILLFARNTAIPFINKVIDSLSKFSGFILSTVAPTVINFLRDPITPLYNKIRELAMQVIPWLINAFQNVSGFITGVAAPAISDFVQNKIIPMIQSIREFVAELVERAQPIIEDFQERLQAALGPAMERIKEAGRDIAKAFRDVGINIGGSGEEVDAITVLLWAFKAVLDVIVWTVTAASKVVKALGDAILWVRNAIDWVINKFNELKSTIEEVENSMPYWLVPGSPTPFEKGIRGIGKALSDIDGFSVGVSGQGTGAGAMGGGIVVNLTYSPAISLADRQEVADKLIPFIKAALGRQDVRARLG